MPTIHYLHNSLLLLLLASLLVIQNHALAQNPSSSTQTTKTIILPKWQLGLGGFYGSVPHYPASNHFYKLATPSPLFIYRFEKTTFKGRQISFPLSAQTQLAIVFGFSVPVGKNNRSENNFPANSNDPKQRIISENNFHRRGMEGLPSILRIGSQIIYSPTSHWSLKLPLLFGLGLNTVNYQGYIASPELSLSLKPNSNNNVAQKGFNLIGSIETEYGDLITNQLYYQVNSEDAIEGRNAYNAKAGEISRSYRIFLRYQHQFDYDNSISFFLSFRRQDFSHSANTQSPLHITNTSEIVAAGFIYYFYSSEKTVNR